MRQHYSYFSPTWAGLRVILLISCVLGMLTYYLSLSYLNTKLYYAYRNANVFDQLLAREMLVPENFVSLLQNDGKIDQLDHRLLHLALWRLGLLDDDDQNYAQFIKKRDGEKKKTFAFELVMRAFDKGEFGDDGKWQGILHPALVPVNASLNRDSDASTLKLIAYLSMRTRDTGPQIYGSDPKRTQELTANLIAAYLADEGNARSGFGKMENSQSGDVQQASGPTAVQFYPGAFFSAPPQPRGEEVIRCLAQQMRWTQTRHGTTTAPSDDEARSTMIRDNLTAGDRQIDGSARFLARMIDQLNADTDVKKWIYWLNVIRGPEQLLILMLFFASLLILGYRRYQLKRQSAEVSLVVNAVRTDTPGGLTTRLRLVNRAIERLLYGYRNVVPPTAVTAVNDESPRQIRVSWDVPDGDARPQELLVIRESDRGARLERRLPAEVNGLVDVDLSAGVGYRYELLGLVRDPERPFYWHESLPASDRNVVPAEMNPIHEVIGNPKPKDRFEFLGSRSYVLSSTGRSIGSTEDSCSLIYQLRYGNFDVATKVDEFRPVSQMTPRVGLMVRESTSPTSRMLFLGFGEIPNKVFLIVRDPAGSIPTQHSKEFQITGKGRPKLRIQRVTHERGPTVFRCQLYETGAWKTVREVMWSKTAEQLLVGPAVSAALHAKFTEFSNVGDSDAAAKVEIVSSVSDRFIAFKWEPSTENESEYMVQYTDDLTNNAVWKSKLALAPSACGFITFEAEKTNKEFRYRLESQWSDWKSDPIKWTVNAAANKPPVPDLPQARAIDSSSVELSFVNVGLYKLTLKRTQLQADGTKAELLFSLVEPRNTYVDPDLLPDTHYTYELQCTKDKNERSDFSQPVYVRTLPLGSSIADEEDKKIRFVNERTAALREGSLSFRLLKVCQDVLTSAVSTNNLSAVRLERARDSIQRDERRSRWLIKWMSYAMPAVDFIGTVRGISQGLGSADSIVRESTSVGQAAAITDVTSMLGLAFATTVAALSLLLVISLLDYGLGAKEAAEIDRLTDSLSPLIET